MSEFVTEAFTNDMGQVIHPGDDVIYMGSSWSTTSVKKGKFAGVYYSKGTISDYDSNGKYIGTSFKRYLSAVRVNQVPTKKFNYDSKTNTGVFVDAVGTAILPLKRVYKLDILMNAFVGKAI